MAKYILTLEDTDEQSGSYSVQTVVEGSDAMETGVVSAAVLSGAALRASMDEPDFLANVMTFANAQLEQSESSGSVKLPTQES